MKAPVVRHETAAFTIHELLHLEPDIEWYKTEYGDNDVVACTPYQTIIRMTRDKYNAPKHAIANVNTGDGGVLVELFWLEAQE